METNYFTKLLRTKMSFAYKNGKNKGDRKRSRKKDIEKD